MAEIKGANIYVLFPSSSPNTQLIIHRIISIPTDEESGPVYKIADAISNHLGISVPPGSAIRPIGLTLNLYFRNKTCQELAIKPFKSNPLLTITRQEWEVANSQIFDPKVVAKPVETSISDATSTIPKIICINNQGRPQGYIQQKPLPKSALFSAIIVFGLLCSLAVVMRATRSTNR